MPRRSSESGSKCTEVGAEFLAEWCLSAATLKPRFYVRGNLAFLVQNSYQSLFLISRSTLEPPPLLKYNLGCFYYGGGWVRVLLNWCFRKCDNSGLQVCLSCLHSFPMNISISSAAPSSNFPLYINKTNQNSRNPL